MPPRVKGMRSDTFKVIDGVRYIQDEEADMRALRYTVRKRKERKARDQKHALIIERCKGLLRHYHCDAQTIAAQCQVVGLEVEVSDVRSAMKSPEALALFRRVRAPMGRIEWVLNDALERGAAQ
jgi:isopenicillin N synthase-like dioxygenase